MADEQDPRRLDAPESDEDLARLIATLAPLIAEQQRVEGVEPDLAFIEALRGQLTATEAEPDPDFMRRLREHLLGGISAHPPTREQALHWTPAVIGIAALLLIGILATMAVVSPQLLTVALAGVAVVIVLVIRMRLRL